jgi:hypothetical protein
MAIAAIGIALLSGCAPSARFYLRDAESELSNSSNVMLVIPLDTIAIEYVDKTKARPDTQFAQSFFIEAANSFYEYEVFKRYRLNTNYTATDSILSRLRTARYSKIAKNADNLDSAKKIIRIAAQQYDVDLILLAYSCSLKHITFKSGGWRSGGPSYERPTTYRSYATSHAQIWNKDGALLYECVATNDAGRPVMYTLFRKKKPDDDIVKYAKHLYAAPLVRALYHAIRESLRIKQPLIR